MSAVSESAVNRSHEAIANEGKNMTRILRNIALGISIVVLGAVAVAPAGAHNNDSSHRFGVRCLSNGMETTMASTIQGSYYAVYLQKYLPPNWIGVGYATNWIAADDFRSVYQNPVGAPITYRSKASFALEPGSYFAWARFAYVNAQGGWSYHWEPADKSCTIHQSVFARGAKKKVAKPRALPTRSPKAPAPTRGPQL